MKNNEKAKIKYPIGSYAPGDYMCKCNTCGEKFIEDKRSRQCEPCAINFINEGFDYFYKRLGKLETALRNITFNNDVINEILGK